MKFPGRRKTKHYFPVTEQGRPMLNSRIPISKQTHYVVGLDQLLVDIEIEVDDAFLKQHDFHKGQSFIIEDELCERIYEHCRKKSLIKGEFPGGAVGNTLHNFAVLSECPCYAFGAIKKQIDVGDYAFKYLSKTSGLVDMSFLQPCEKPMGRALCFITPDMERTFAISKGCMNDFSSEYVSEKIIQNASAVLISAYTLRVETDPVYHATITMCEMAKKHHVPVVMSLGTSTLVDSKVDFLKDFTKKYVSVLAMNQEEGFSFTGDRDPLLACEKILDLVNMVLFTVGEKGLYLAAYTDDEHKRETAEPLVTKSLVNYNQYEYSRAMAKDACQKSIKIYSHISPYNGGPITIKNTNGAGDAALSALLHDITANNYHRDLVPNSPKHDSRYLTYSSISQVSKYANRVSFEVLIQNSPRLFKPLPEKDDSLEEAYWSK